VCAPPDFAELLAGVGVPLVPIGQPVTGATPPSAADLPPHAAELVARPVRHRRRGGRET
jgi:vancomycin aglycone glucosyltransferase